MRVRLSAPVQTGPGAYPASCTMGTGSFLVVNRPGRGADHPSPSKCRGQERVGLYLYSPSGLSWPVTWEHLYPLPFMLQSAWIPGLLHADRRDRSLKDFQGPYRESNPEPPVSLHISSSYCTISWPISSIFSLIIGFQLNI